MFGLFNKSKYRAIATEAVRLLTKQIRADFGDESIKILRESDFFTGYMCTGIDAEVKLKTKKNYIF